MGNFLTVVAAIIIVVVIAALVVWPFAAFTALGWAPVLWPVWLRAAAAFILLTFTFAVVVIALNMND